MIILLILSIYILNIINRLKTYFSFNINNFYHYFISIIKFLILIIYLLKFKLKASNLF